MRPSLAIAEGAVVVGFVLAVVGAASAGDLDPPAGPVGPTMKTLTQIEPRTPVDTLAGDAMFVHRITQPGSYYLTGDVTGASGKTGIGIDADNVTLDLNGFSLIGVSGSGSGVFVENNHTNVTIGNGTVRGWAGYGVCTVNAVGVRMYDLAVVGNTNYGIYASAAQVTRCTAKGNGSIGIYAYNGSFVSDCTAYLNSSQGISVSGGTTILHCAAAYNQGVGLVVSSRAAVYESTATNNTSHGIGVYGSCVAARNTAFDNGTGGDGAGIYVNYAGNRIEGNQVLGNPRGIDVDAAGNVIVGNSAGWNTTNFDIVANNLAGTIVSTGAALNAASNALVNFDMGS
jgi:parallel beta-helix repeat protein